ncbi:MAG: hypothetical protein IT338_20340 [Thermomicrobiales bacterium]|nr:hypothetical protein [Thermomicrobiales bacterium]
MPAWLVQHVAAAAGTAGVDIDATSAVNSWLALRLGTLESAYVPVRSVWLPCEAVNAAWNQRLIERLSERQESGPPRVVLVLPPGGTLRELTKCLEPILATASPWPLAIGLSSGFFKGGRPHLVQLGAIRRFAEEWDLVMAVDLSGRFDPTWEAEAAIARIGDRLSILRLGVTAPSRSAIGRDRVACRALHAAIDRGHAVDIALSSVRLAPLPIAPRGATEGIRRATGYILDRAAFHAEALREGIDHFEGSPSSRGS